MKGLFKADKIVFYGQNLANSFSDSSKFMDTELFRGQCWTPWWRQRFLYPSHIKVGSISNIFLTNSPTLSTTSFTSDTLFLTSIILINVIIFTKDTLFLTFIIVISKASAHDQR